MIIKTLKKETIVTNIFQQIKQKILHSRLEKKIKRSGRFIIHTDALSVFQSNRRIFEDNLSKTNHVNSIIYFSCNNIRIKIFDSHNIYHCEYYTHSISVCNEQPKTI